MNKHILIFANGYRPVLDHLHGLFQAALVNNDQSFVFIFYDYSLFQYFKNNYDLVQSTVRIILRPGLSTLSKLLFQSSLIFGFPACRTSKIILFLSQLINRELLRVVVPPGNILKASGNFKLRRPFLPVFLRNYVFSFLFPYKILASSLELAAYSSIAYAYPLRTLCISPLPKHLYLQNSLNKYSKKNIIVFSPTHRWDDVIPPLLDLLCDDIFVERLTSLGYQLEYTLHPNTLPPSGLKAKPFSGSWANVVSLVTDYSSLGHDYHFSGGQNLVYYLSDHLAFDAHEGSSPFLMNHILRHTSIFSLDELLSFYQNLSLALVSSTSHNYDLVKKFHLSNFFHSISLSSNRL